MKRSLIHATWAVLVGTMAITRAQQPTLSQSELDDLARAVKKDSLLAGAMNEAGDPVKLYETSKTNIRAADSLWRYDQDHLKPLHDLGSTHVFEMLPLIDSFTSNGGLETESAVAYLIRTDDATILFDLGENVRDTDPSPLLVNMKRLGTKREDIDIIVISHPHSDHIGGFKGEDKSTFSLTSRQLDLGHRRVYTPIPMTYPGLKPVCSQQPTKIA